MTPGPATRIGAVAIGRNEALHLRRCLASLRRELDRVVYVDSGSSDGSPAIARALGVDLVELDPGRPFTAARARNAGFRRLMAQAPDLPFVLFVDGDCELRPGWIGAALEAFDADPDGRLAAVAGRLRERHPERSIYHWLCDAEWATPPGEVAACGGNAAYRCALLTELGGFDERLIGGEEPELCYRIRRRGGRIRQLAVDMAWHDADMLRFGQWWRRMVRSGYATADAAWLHGCEPERLGVRRCLAILGWGAGVPAVAVGLAIGFGGPGLLALAAYPLYWARILRAERARGQPRSGAARLATFYVLDKFPQLWGLARSALDRALRRPSHPIEHRRPGRSPPAARQGRTHD